MRKTKQNKPECKLVIAGPGAGKTHSMVQKVLECMGTLHPTRFCVVITYTNSATEEIKSRLASHVKIPANVFIGTIHSFLNKFIIIPYLSLIKTNFNIDKTFLQISSDEIVRGKMNKSGRDVAIIRKKLYEHLNQKGLITFDQTIDLSIEILKNRKIKELVCRRLEYLFIDEFQDVSNKQFNIIETIRKTKKTRIYCVGDPEQYISGFSNPRSEFKGIPILKSCNNNQYHLDFIFDNHRSSFPIVSFLNNFNTRQYRNNIFNQKKIKNSNISKHEIYYINSSNLNTILNDFEHLYTTKCYKHKDVFILAKKNIIIKNVSKKRSSFNVKSKNNVTSPIQVIINLITTLYKKSEFALITEANISKIDFRVIVMKCIKREIIDENGFIEFVENELGIKTTKEINKKQHSPLIKKDDFKINKSKIEYPTISNIHNAKGLEKKVVLCIAKTKKELELWLETNESIRTETIKKIKDGKEKKDSEIDDYPRLGYVAFSRARELLCIACLEEIDFSLTKKIGALGMKLYIK